METTKYIAFLRGINIGGRRVKMERLRELFAELGFDDVRTFIQTGNVFFDAPEQNAAALAGKIEQHLAASLGYAVPTFLRTVAEVEQVLRLAPFDQIELTGDKRFLVTFVSAPLPADFALPHRSPHNDYEILAATRGEVFSVYQVSNNKIGDPAAFLEKKFKIKTTSRFLHTAHKILDAAKN